MTRLAFGCLALVLGCGAPAGSRPGGATREARDVPVPPRTALVGTFAGGGARMDTAATREYQDSLRAHGLAAGKR